jgi:protein O-mannosyl-transferase
VFGASARGHHQASVVLHALNVLLLFLLLNHLTHAKWRSLAVAAIFGLHPLRVESVAWISERKDVLSAFFFMLTLWAYTRYAESAGNHERPEGRPESRMTESAPQAAHRVPWFTPQASGFYILSLVCFALGLMSKPMLVTLPFVLLLLDYWPLGRFSAHGPRSTLEGPASTARKPQMLSRILLEKLPFCLFSVGLCVVTLAVQKSGKAVDTARPLMVHLENAVVAYGRYLGKLLWPAGLSIHYPYPDHWPAAVILASAGLLSAVVLLVLLARRRHPYLLTGWFWYLGMLVPVIGLVQVGAQSIADRYTYLPCIGALIVLVWGASELARCWRTPAVLLGAAACLASLACIGASRRQIGFWKDSGTLFQHALEVTENNNLALMHLASHFRQQGRLEEAIELYRRALQIDPLAEESQVNLGVLLYMSGRKEEGIQQLAAAAQALPKSAMVHSNLGLFLLSQGRLDEAARHLETALQLNPNSAQAHVAFGDVCEKQGRRGAAIEHYREALRLQPGFAPAERRLQSMGDP